MEKIDVDSQKLTDEICNVLNFRALTGTMVYFYEQKDVPALTECKQKAKWGLFRAGQKDIPALTDYKRKAKRGLFRAFHILKSCDVTLEELG